MRSEKIDDCGCRLERTEAGLHMVECPLHGMAKELLEAVKEAHVFVGEWLIENAGDKDEQCFAKRLFDLINKAEGREKIC